MILKPRLRWAEAEAREASDAEAEAELRCWARRQAEKEALRVAVREGAAERERDETQRERRVAEGREGSAHTSNESANAAAHVARSLRLMQVSGKLFAAIPICGIPISGNIDTHNLRVQLRRRCYDDEYVFEGLRVYLAGGPGAAGPRYEDVYTWGVWGAKPPTCFH